MNITCDKESLNQLTENGRDKFYVYGISGCAQIFYIGCLLNGFENMIEGFLVSDLNTVKRKDKKLHRREIHEPIILKDKEKPTVVICAYNFETQEEIINHVLEYNPDTGIHIFGGESARETQRSYVEMAKEYIGAEHDISDSKFETPFLNVCDKGSGCFFKYMLKLGSGSIPDTRVFGEGIKLDELHRKQIGEYRYIGDGEKDEPESRFSIYMAKSHVDKKLAEDCDSLYTYPIQVGAALTKQRICELRDDAGENLSLRNRDYCELSALFWAWKNDHKSDYIGLCHYRRRFVLTKRQFAYIEEQNLDAVYTVPKIIDQGVEYEFVERCNHVKEEAWRFLEEAIYKLYPDYAAAWEELKRMFFLITLNMSIMKRDVLEDYCSWLFSILSEVDRHYTDQGIQPDNRYLGYLGECLTTVYVLKNRDWLKFGYTEIQFLQPAQSS